ncbi:MAG: nitroreductase [Promethearchaeota archaeon]|nr:MAG: nitroreductase [Candidatus Lokiarchaeota archaeon]
MNVQESIVRRKSIRKFEKGMLSDEQLQTLMKAAQLAPSASNRQPYTFIIVKDDELKKELSKKASIQRFIREALVIFVGVGDPEHERWYKVDLAIAMEHLALQAVELGLGCCWLGAFEEDKVKEILKIPEHLMVLALLPIGIPAHDPPARPRKPIEELFFTNYFQ